MQTIRIYSYTGGLVASFTGAPHKVENDKMRAQYPETHYMWVR